MSVERTDNRQVVNQRFNTLKLASTVLGHVLERDHARAIQWAHAIGVAADRLSRVVVSDEDLESLPDHAEAAA
jgi:hypothetical protein